jgi:hypothetical protein
MQAGNPLPTAANDAVRLPSAKRAFVSMLTKKSNHADKNLNAENAAASVSGSYTLRHADKADKNLLNH